MTARRMPQEISRTDIPVRQLLDPNDCWKVWRSRSIDIATHSCSRDAEVFGQPRYGFAIRFKPFVEAHEIDVPHRCFFVNEWNLVLVNEPERCDKGSTPDGDTRCVVRSRSGRRG